MIESVRVRSCAERKSRKVLASWSARRLASGALGAHVEQHHLGGDRRDHHGLLERLGRHVQVQGLDDRLGDGPRLQQTDIGGHRQRLVGPGLVSEHQRDVAHGLAGTSTIQVAPSTMPSTPTLDPRPPATAQRTDEVVQADQARRPTQGCSAGPGASSRHAEDIIAALLGNSVTVEPEVLPWTTRSAGSERSCWACSCWSSRPVVRSMASGSATTTPASRRPVSSAITAARARSSAVAVPEETASTVTAVRGRCARWAAAVDHCQDHGEVGTHVGPRVDRSPAGPCRARSGAQAAHSAVAIRVASGRRHGRHPGRGGEGCGRVPSRDRAGRPTRR